MGLILYRENIFSGHQVNRLLFFLVNNDSSYDELVMNFSPVFIRTVFQVPYLLNIAAMICYRCF